MVGNCATESYVGAGFATAGCGGAGFATASCGGRFASVFTTHARFLDDAHVARKGARVEVPEVRKCRTRADHVVGIHRRISMRQLDFDQFRAHRTQGVGGVDYRLAHLSLQTERIEERRHHADAHVLNATPASGNVVDRGDTLRARSLRQTRLRIGECHLRTRALPLRAHPTISQHVHRERGIKNAARDGARLVNCIHESRDAATRNSPVAGFHRYDAAKRTWLADGSARIGAERNVHQTRRSRSNASARRAAGHALKVPRVVRVSKRRGLGGATERKLVQVELTQKNRVRIEDALHAIRRLRGHKVREQRGTAGRMRARPMHVVLERHGNARKGPKRVALACGDRSVDARRRFPRLMRRNLKERMDFAIVGLDTRKAFLRDLGSRKLAGEQARANLRRRHIDEAIGGMRRCVFFQIHFSGT